MEQASREKWAGEMWDLRCTNIEEDIDGEWERGMNEVAISRLPPPAKEGGELELITAPREEKGKYSHVHKKDKKVV